MAPPFTTRIAGALSGIAARVESVARRLRGPEESRVADVPGVPHMQGPRPDERIAAQMDTWGLFSSRVSPLAGPTRTRWALWPGDGLTPETIISAQREAITSGIPLRWVELIDQVYSRDGHYASCTDQRIADVVKGTWRLDPSVHDPLGFAVANFCDETYRSTSRWVDGLEWLLRSNQYAYNAVENEWKEDRVTFAGPRGETIGPVEVAVPAKLHVVHPKHFRFDLETDDPRFWLGTGFQPLPLGKFLFMNATVGAHPINVRRGHAWQCIWYSLFRSIGWSGWATFVERFAMPTPVIGYNGDLAQFNEYKQAMEDILAACGTGKGVRYPRENFTLELKDPPRGGTSSDPHSQLSSACDAAQSIRILGAEMVNMTGNVGSYAAKEKDIETKYGLEELDAVRLWERIDEQLTRPLLQFNAEALATALNAKGYNVTPADILRRAPRGKHHIPGKTDPKAELDLADTAANKLGLRISKRHLFQVMDFVPARDDDDVVCGEATQVSKGAALVGAVGAANDGVIVPDQDQPRPGTPDAKQEPQAPQLAAEG